MAVSTVWFCASVRSDASGDTATGCGSGLCGVRKTTNTELTGSNGIGNVVVKADLLDRAVAVELPRDFAGEQFVFGHVSFLS